MACASGASRRELSTAPLSNHGKPCASFFDNGHRRKRLDLREGFGSKSSKITYEKTTHPDRRHIDNGCAHLCRSTECIQADQIRCEPSRDLELGKIINPGIQGQAG